MGINSAVEHLSITQKVAILLLSAKSFQPIKGKLWFQKEFFLVAENLSQLQEETDFEEDLLGPYSEIVDEELEQLRLEGIVEKRKLQLTPLGREIAKSLQSKVSNNFLQLVSDIKSFLNDLTEDELLGFIYFSYPYMTTESIRYKQIEENRQQIAISLYRKGKVSLGKASQIAGISQEDFIEKLREKRITIFSE